MLILWLPAPVAAFGAGNIASVSGLEGKAFRHGDIEDCIKDLVMAKGAFSLLNKKFGTMDVKRIYFGESADFRNWLRDYSQAIDVGTLGRGIPLASLITLVAVLGFSAHGYATEEFEVTEQRLGCYRCEEHIDNPKGYADGQDARQHHPGLRGPVDPRELEVDPRTGLKNYIANEQGGWATSSAYVRGSLRESIDQYRAGNRHEAMRLLGQALHTLEDFPAHSNFVELALIELGHERVFPFVGEQAAFRHVADARTGRPRPVYPVVTGTFGASDFVHSLLGEATDHVSSASVTGLEKAIDDAKRSGGPSELVELLGKAPGMSDVTREVEDVDRAPVNLEDPAQVKDRIWGLLVLRDKIVKAVELTVEKIPGLSWLAEKISESVQLFMLTRLEPYVKPLLSQVVGKLEAGSDALLSSEQQQEVFNDARCSDPTHSMLSKDHFALYLNEVRQVERSEHALRIFSRRRIKADFSATQPAGRVATCIVEEVVKAVAEAWSSGDEATTQRAIDTAMQVFFHPADLGTRKTPLQERLLDVVRTWANENPSLIRHLEKESVRAGRNRRSEEGGSSGCGGGPRVPAPGPGACYVPTPSAHNTGYPGLHREEPQGPPGFGQAAHGPRVPAPEAGACYVPTPSAHNTGYPELSQGEPQGPPGFGQAAHGQGYPGSRYPQEEEHGHGDHRLPRTQDYPAQQARFPQPAAFPQPGPGGHGAYPQQQARQSASQIHGYEHQQHQQPPPPSFPDPAAFISRDAEDRR
ncbi:MAG: heterokaryon incompatibility protein HET-C [Olpidium bornovanus]|uniref:Heterokaryon incompatibility protein HET-C n=1 Tax=Olpidium bornovanus TaxID=278681 RepID=A0A8H8DHH1_9FUNG|nr:MAG: heterokaryon incompatibility protein HET-C [Olpidium bornovanus]